MPSSSPSPRPARGSPRPADSARPRVHDGDGRVVGTEAHRRDTPSNLVSRTTSALAGSQTLRNPLPTLATRVPLAFQAAPSWKRPPRPAGSIGSAATSKKRTHAEPRADEPAARRRRVRPAGERVRLDRGGEEPPRPLEVPDPDGPVLSGAVQRGVIGAERDGDRPLSEPQPLADATRRHVPDACRSDPTTRTPPTSRHGRRRAT